MEIKLKHLLDLQKKVNDKVLEKMDRDIFVEEFILAFNVEYFEFMNEIGVWKWWKHSHEINRERILDELADLYAFFLSILITSKDNLLKEFENKYITLEEFEERDIKIEEIEEELTRISSEVYATKDQPYAIENLMLVIGTDNESDTPVRTVNRFGVAIGIARILFDGITYEEITEAYEKKSQVNIDRQNENY